MVLTMKHLAAIQVEFLKEARKWDDMTFDDQKAYLKRHPQSKRRLTSKKSDELTTKAKALAKAKRLAVLKTLPDDYESFFKTLKQKYPKKKKLIDKLQARIEDTNSVNYMARYEKDSKDKTQKEKSNTKKWLNNMFKDVDRIMSKL